MIVNCILSAGIALATENHEESTLPFRYSVSLNHLDSSKDVVVIGGTKIDILIMLSNNKGLIKETKIIVPSGEIPVQLVCDKHPQFLSTTWKIPDIEGVIPFTFHFIFNDKVYTDIIEVKIIKNDPPIIKDVLISGNSYSSASEIIILNSDQLYNFEVIHEDPDKDPVEVIWEFVDMNSLKKQRFMGYQINWYAPKNSTAFNVIVTVHDRKYDEISKYISIFTDNNNNNNDNTVNDEIAKKIDELINILFNFLLNRNLEVFKVHLHPETEDILIQHLETFLDPKDDLFSYNQCWMYELLPSRSRYFTEFDEELEQFKTFVF